MKRFLSLAFYHIGDTAIRYDLGEIYCWAMRISVNLDIDNVVWTHRGDCE
jgi:hypothetical protein